MAVGTFYFMDWFPIFENKNTGVDYKYRKWQKVAARNLHVQGIVSMFMYSVMSSEIPVA